ncbi:hypothetical protein KJI95_02100 [Shewanella sp. JM162201]|uniref:Uncharacterized protein n=1 Tax=Shewanella jiangmenensis TaxID=2837387 RepID=A0ABS5V0M5_9GAMM|nr:hypothetical protein [Shewanella jiangmenensis]MBT1443321.1 hypothetical protein [Shewanella jiangmenensis]
MHYAKLTEARAMLERQLTLTDVKRYATLSHGSDEESLAVKALRDTLLDKLSSDEDLLFAALEQGLL